MHRSPSAVGSAGARCLSAVLALALCLPGPAATAQDAPPDTSVELPPVEAPPELPGGRKQALEREIAKLRNDHAPARAKAEETIVAFGRGALPALLDASTAVHAGQRDSLVNCLARLADLRDRELVDEHLDSERVVLRRFAARAAGQFALESQLSRLPPLLTDADEGVAREAALALVRCGRPEGLPLAATLYSGPDKERVLEVLPGIIGKGRHEPLAERLKLDPRREQEEPAVAAAERQATVELLAAIGDDAARVLLVSALDDKHNVVQRKAIDALRDLLENQGPLQASSIFQQIREVERLKALWQERSRG